MSWQWIPGGFPCAACREGGGILLVGAWCQRAAIIFPRKAPAATASTEETTESKA